MSDNTQETQEQSEATVSVDEPQDNNQDTTEQSDKAAESREAAKYRTRLRETEAERDDLAQQLKESRKQIVEDISGLQRPEGLWAAGVDVDTLIDDDGRVDRKAVQEAVATATDTLGLARRPSGPYSSAFGAVTGEPVKAKQDFATAFAPKPK